MMETNAQKTFATQFKDALTPQSLVTTTMLAHLNSAILWLDVFTPKRTVTMESNVQEILAIPPLESANTNLTETFALTAKLHLAKSTVIVMLGLKLLIFHLNVLKHTVTQKLEVASEERKPFVQKIAKNLASHTTTVTKLLVF